MNTIDQSVKRPKLHYLDGFRGLAALIIAVYHAQIFTGNGTETASLPLYLKPLSIIISYGHLAVPAFIVLSGYSLTIPVAISKEKSLNGGFISYIKRRARRILPPYYVTLIFFLLLIFTVPVLQIPHNTAWDSKIPITVPVIVSHIFLVHNVNAEWIYKINGPLWSVATEWQIYFIFPGLILLWKKINLLTSVISAILIGIVISIVFMPARMMHLWFVGLFAMGMLGATINFSNDSFWANIREGINWKKLTYYLMFFTALFLIYAEYRHISHILLDTVIGFFLTILIVFLTYSENIGLKRNFLLRMLNSKFFIVLGAFSYSIYLIHSPFLGLINLITLDLPITYPVKLLLMELIAVPVCIFIAYIFYLLVEKKFQKNIVNLKVTPLELNKSNIKAD